MKIRPKHIVALRAAMSELKASRGFYLPEDYRVVEINRDLRNLEELRQLLSDNVREQRGAKCDGK